MAPARELGTTPGHGYSLQAVMTLVSLLTLAIVSLALAGRLLLPLYADRYFTKIMIGCRTIFSKMVSKFHWQQNDVTVFWAIFLEFRPRSSAEKMLSLQFETVESENARCSTVVSFLKSLISRTCNYIIC